MAPWVGLQAEQGCQALGPRGERQGPSGPELGTVDLWGG